MGMPNKWWAFNLREPKRSALEFVARRNAIGGVPFWNKSIERLLSELGTTADGLASPEAQRRLVQFGPNDAAALKRSAGWVRFLARFGNPLVIILLIASAPSAVTGDIPSFVIVVTIIAASVVMEFLQEQRAEDAVHALREQVALRALTARDGEEIDLPVSQLVPCDVVRLVAGDLVPSDGRLLDARYFFAKQALLTVEPTVSRKTQAMLANR